MFRRMVLGLGTLGSLGSFVVACWLLDGRWLVVCAALALGSLWTHILCRCVVHLARYRGYAKGGSLRLDEVVDLIDGRSLDEQFADLDAELCRPAHLPRLLATARARRRDRLQPTVPERLAWIEIKHHLERDDDGGVPA